MLHGFLMKKDNIFFFCFTNWTTCIRQNVQENHQNKKDPAKGYKETGGCLPSLPLLLLLARPLKEAGVVAKFLGEEVKKRWWGLKRRWWLPKRLLCCGNTAHLGQTLNFIFLFSFSSLLLRREEGWKQEWASVCTLQAEWLGLQNSGGILEF